MEWLFLGALALASIWVIMGRKKETQPYIRIDFGRIVPSKITGRALRQMYLDSVAIEVTDDFAGMVGLDPEDILKRRMRDYMNDEVRQILDKSLMHDRMLDIHKPVDLDTGVFVITPQFTNPPYQVKILMRRAAVEVSGVVH